MRLVNFTIAYCIKYNEADAVKKFVKISIPSQFLPANPFLQMQIYIEGNSWHRPPFRQGLIGEHFASAVEMIEIRLVTPVGIYPSE